MIDIFGAKPLFDKTDIHFFHVPVCSICSTEAHTHTLAQVNVKPRMLYAEMSNE